MKKIIFSIIMIMCGVNNGLAFNDNEKKEIGGIVREYLLENPELFFEIQEKLAEYQKEQNALAVVEVIKTRHDEIFNNPKQAIMGNPNGDISIVEFFDYNCFYCKKALGDMEKIIQNNPDVKIILKEFPVFGEDSIGAGQISIAVNRLYPEEYQEFHTQLLRLEDKKNMDVALKLANEMGLNVNEILKATNNNIDIAEEIEMNNQIAQELQISGTPAFVIGNEVVFGAQESSVFENIIKNIRKCGETKCS